MSNPVVFSIPGIGLSYPDFIYLDTNSVVEIGLNRTYSNQVMTFMKDATKNDTIFVYSSHMYEELKQTIHVDLLNREMKNQGFKVDKKNSKPPWKQFEDTGVNIGPTTISVVNDLVDILKSTTANTLYELEEAPSEELRPLIDAYISVGIAPKDAKHSAIMNYNGLNNILTLDKGFMKVPDINIYAPNRSLTNSSIAGATSNPYQSILQQQQNTTSAP